jgi:hypothetical protein
MMQRGKQCTVITCHCWVSKDLVVLDHMGFKLEIRFVWWNYLSNVPDVVSFMESKVSQKVKLARGIILET